MHLYVHAVMLTCMLLDSPLLCDAYVVSKTVKWSYVASTTVKPRGAFRV